MNTGVQRIKRNVYPHTPFYFYFLFENNVDKKRNDEKGAEDGGMQKSFSKLFYMEREKNGWDVMIMVSGGAWREVPS